MASYLDKVSIQTPTKKMRDFDLSCQQLTTQFFMRPNIAYAKEFPQAKIKCNLKSYARMQPLYKPVLGSVQVHNRAFFVPFRVVWDPWSSFIVNAPYNTPGLTQILNMVPTVYEGAFVLFFLQNGFLTQVSQGSPFDVTFNGNFYEFDYRGRHYYKILRQLGYGLNFSLRDVIETSGMMFSALPLLCYAKLFLDWYFPSQYAHSGISAGVEGMFNRNFRYDLTVADLNILLPFTAWCYYRNDYFVSAWDNPVSPSDGSWLDDIVFPDITLPDGLSDVNLFNGSLGDGTPVLSFKSSFSQYGVDSLKALTNYVKRHQLVGARVLDRYLADFGVALTAEKLRRSVYVGSQSFPIQFQDVMSNADTEDAPLGEYAGKGVAYGGDGNFVYDTDEFGMFIIVNSVEPDVAYYQGIDRNTLHLRPFEFLNQQYESLGTQPVLKAELNYPIDNRDGMVSEEDLFGFLPRYSEYKVGRDLVTGLFSLPDTNRGMLGWSTVRQVAVGGSHDIDFMRGDDAWQYARIFYGDVNSPEDERDKFIFVHRVNLKAAMRAMPMYDTYDFDEPEGETIKMQANGVQL